MKYIASNTTMHIPKVFGWNLDSDNPVGLEYMILGKISGVSANSVWDTLPLELKQVMVSEIADFIVQLFRLRSDTAGSLYTDDDGKQVVGPIIATPFYRALDGWVRLDSSTYRELASLRGPFTTVTGYLRSFLEAELFLVREYRQRILEHELHGDEERLELGRTVLEKAVELCSLYPGEICVSEPLTSPEHPFSIRLDDFRLSNMMIDEETGHVTGIIDFEGATVAPLWECAYLPRWLQDYDEWDGSHEGGSAEDKQLLRNLFMKRIQELDPDGEWIRALEQGRPFREFTNLLSFNVGVWMNQEKWVRERLEWAKTHPGIAFPSEIDTLS
ncbi:kinase-like protein [Favolaschia claudopus]|uniref:Kinase-like protein n=1 Tax=Favolaschia claudopus TaxID=2862362 RepID=A0AAW0D2F5_9AGAR